MRRVLLFILIIGIGGSSPLFGQDTDSPEDQILIGGVQQSGGYGAPTVAMTTINGGAAILVGGQGGWVINRRFVIGGAGRGMADRQETRVNGEPIDFQMGYGGLLLEYIGAPSRLVHYGGEVLIGGGDARLSDEDVADEEAGDNTSFFASEVGGRLELNVTTFFRIGLSGGYRLIIGSNLPGLSDTDLGGPYGQLSFRFGSF